MIIQYACAALPEDRREAQRPVYIVQIWGLRAMVQAYIARIFVLWASALRPHLLGLVGVS